MPKVRKKRPDPQRIKLIILALLSGMGFFLVLLGWLDYHGYFVSPDAMYIHILAKSFWKHPYVIPFKRAFSYPFEIIHHDFTFPPIPPLIHWFLGVIGVTTWHRANWLTAFSMGMIVPAWMWALKPHLDEISTDEKRNRKKFVWHVFFGGWIATLWLLAQAQNQMWHELYLGIVSPAAVCLFLLSYGAYLRQQYVLCGIITAIAFLIRFDAQVTLAILVFGHIIGHFDLKKWKKIAVDCLKMGIPFLAVTSPWWMRSILLGYSPFFNHMVPIFLYGESGHFRWFPDTDTGSGPRHQVTDQPLFAFYEQLVRNRWNDFLNPYLGTFLTELIGLPGFAFFLILMYGIYRPRHRPLAAFIALGLVLRISIVAGLHDAFNRRYFLILDATVITWIMLMLWDKNRWLRLAAASVIAISVYTGWRDLKVVLRSMRPYVGYLEGHSPGISQAIAEINQTREPVLTAQIVGHAVAYYTDDIPVLELNTNYKEPGIEDQFLDRWRIKYTTEAEALRPYVTKHEFVEVRASNGYTIHEVRPLAPKPPASRP